MMVDIDPFPSVTVGMVDAHLPNNKEKGKAEFVLIQHIPKQNSRPQIKIDIFSNEPHTEFSGPTIVEPMSNSSTEETNGPTVLCSNCKARVILIEPKEKPPQTPTPQQPSKVAATPPKELGES
ncbi:hypothetical protein ACFX1R_039673 [Malus domestica]